MNRRDLFRFTAGAALVPAALDLTRLAPSSPIVVAHDLKEAEKFSASVRTQERLVRVNTLASDSTIQAHMEHGDGRTWRKISSLPAHHATPTAVQVTFDDGSTLYQKLPVPPLYSSFRLHFAEGNGWYTTWLEAAR